MKRIGVKIKVAPSILSADFSCLDREIKRAESAGADMLHIDVMDGHFVPNITIGPCVVEDIRRITKLPLDVHLMIENPRQFADNFVDAGADMITMHIETISKSELKTQKSKLEAKGIKFGISLNPATALSRIKDVLEYVDFVLVMTVNPGFSGQQFIPAVVPKIRQLRFLFKGDISVDGGVNDKLSPVLIDAGATILVSGSYIFGAKNIKSAVERIKNGRK
ncbi:MAG: ribulose-phosphate 3-epimerase [Candidatus Omnitrophota bacterium]